MNSFFQRVHSVISHLPLVSQGSKTDRDSKAGEKDAKVQGVAAKLIGSGGDEPKPLDVKKFEEFSLKKAETLSEETLKELQAICQCLRNNPSNDLSQTVMSREETLSFTENGESQSVDVNPKVLYLESAYWQDRMETSLGADANNVNVDQDRFSAESCVLALDLLHLSNEERAQKIKKIDDPNLLLDLLEIRTCWGLPGEIKELLDGRLLEVLSTQTKEDYQDFPQGSLDTIRIIAQANGAEDVTAYVLEAELLINQIDCEPYQAYDREKGENVIFTCINFEKGNSQEAVLEILKKYPDLPLAALFFKGSLEEIPEDAKLPFHLIIDLDLEDPSAQNCLGHFPKLQGLTLNSGPEALRDHSDFQKSLQDRDIDILEEKIVNGVPVLNIWKEEGEKT